MTDPRELADKIDDIITSCRLEDRKLGFGEGELIRKAANTIRSESTATENDRAAAAHLVRLKLRALLLESYIRTFRALLETSDAK